MTKVLTIGFICFSTALFATAGQSVATATSSDAFELHGNLVNVQGVPSWPLLAGDDVVARGSTVEISMKDGSRLTLSPNSHVRIESTTDGLSANLVSGSMQLALVTDSHLRILKGGVSEPVRSGLISVGNNIGGMRPLYVRAPPPPTPVSGR